ncbi:MAG: glycoside hydrolase family 13 protein [Ruminococcaceae bacterium]|nr:glycoside hydrolase family 13 protein [Oscillospiraceae bacterium]
MLVQIADWAKCTPILKKRINGTDVSARGSFAYGEYPEFIVEAPRKLGASAVVLRICKDGENDRDYPFSFTSTDGVADIYTLCIDTAALCGEEEDGIFFYEILFLRGLDTLFTNTHNNVDFLLTAHPKNRFLLLIHKKDLKTPEWFWGSTMYQIFVDRFAIGEGEVGKRDDVIMNDDWYGGVPQYAEIPGQDVKNNMFFGGNLWGVAEKLEYLKSMGVGVLYLNPIFRAYSNHKYDTGDYFEIDAMFGGEAAFDALVDKANELGIKIILDGVFNHTGDNSRYFDRYGEYGGDGAYTLPDSKYRDWYRFGKDRDDFESWWGIKILPRLDHANESCRRFFTDKDGVGAHYIKKGIAGWRLDVADELSDEFLDEFCDSVRSASGGEAVVIGEVWENAATKIAYGKRRRYLRGGQLDSVMNYPFRNAVLDFVIKRNANALADTLKSIYSSYPKCVSDSLMNILGTHDTERILTVLGKQDAAVCSDAGSMLAKKQLDEEERRKAAEMLKLASALQFTVYGVPSVYYGDEAGVEGYRDPFCRRPYPWGREDGELLAHYRMLGAIRVQNRDVLADGEFSLKHAKGGLIVYSRRSNSGEICVIANAGGRSSGYKLDGEWRDLVSGETYRGSVGALSFSILRRV